MGLAMPPEAFAVKFADQGGAANVSPILATTTLKGSGAMTDFHLSRTDVERKHRGSWAEMIACAWLLQQGYEVFRNVSQHGACDMIALKDGAFTKFDVKCKAGLTIQRLKQCQVDDGVILLAVGTSGEVSIEVDGGIREYVSRQCDSCGTEFLPHRPHNRFCSKPCNLREKRRRYRDAVKKSEPA